MPWFKWILTHIHTFVLLLVLEESVKQFWGSATCQPTFMLILGYIGHWGQWHHADLCQLRSGFISYGEEKKKFTFPPLCQPQFHRTLPPVHHRHCCVPPGCREPWVWQEDPILSWHPVGLSVLPPAFCGGLPRCEVASSWLCSMCGQSMTSLAAATQHRAQPLHQRQPTAWPGRAKQALRCFFSLNGQEESLGKEQGSQAFLENSRILSAW